MIVVVDDCELMINAVIYRHITKNINIFVTYNNIKHEEIFKEKEKDNV